MRILKRYPVLIGVIGTIAVGSMLAAADDSQVPAPVPVVTESAPASPTPAELLPTPEPTPDASIDLPPLPVPLEPSEPAPTAPEVLPVPEPEPTFEYVEPVPWVPGAPIGDLPPEPIHEDDPRFDCRYMGNQQCGVQISGTWYVVSFDAGTPTGVHLRGF